MDDLAGVDPVPHRGGLDEERGTGELGGPERCRLQVVRDPERADGGGLAHGGGTLTRSCSTTRVTSVASVPVRLAATSPKAAHIGQPSATPAWAGTVRRDR